jgi:hypothetical protein
MEPLFLVDPELRNNAKRIIREIDNGEVDKTDFANMPPPSRSETTAIRFFIEQLLGALCPELRSNSKTRQFEMDIEGAKRAAQELYVVAGF